MLQLADLHFEIRSAVLQASISDPYWCDTYNKGDQKELSWGIDVHTKETDLDGDRWAPYVYHQSLKYPIRHWMELAHQKVVWDAPYDEESGVPNGGFYVWEHGSINKGELRILDRDGADFHIEWEGDCNVYWDDKYGEHVPFSLQTVAGFKEVYVHGNEIDSNDTFMDRLAAYIDPNDFVQQAIEKNGHCYSSGVGMAHCRFLPKL